YNKYATTTGPCLESLLRDPDIGLFEIIVVDNASTDSSAHELQQLAAKTDKFRLILNTTNRGFAGGNNDGVAFSRSEIVILLNSDTLVPPAALGRLAMQLRQHDEWAMLGPVTNAAGTEQKIFVVDDDPGEILTAGAIWCQHAQGAFYPSNRLDFFCVAIRKKAYQQLGGLDENFGLGYFEDTDFSMKALQNGFKMMVTEDVFIYHQAGQSFSRFKKQFVKKLMRQNRRLLQQKYGRDCKLRHLRDCNLEILEAYARQREQAKGKELTDLDFRFSNRMKLARNLTPNNPIKQLLYSRKLRRIAQRFECRGHRD
ncbi:MAG: glycosyltransferase family 2 protein, partial [Desulfobulbaceae bacterium]|nr:glycosyltransferase family 2 protein [Desulfobulbaceae bacterium]